MPTRGFGAAAPGQKIVSECLEPCSDGQNNSGPGAASVGPDATTTDNHRQPQTGTGSHRQPQTATGSHRQPQTATNSHRQPQTATDSHRQPQTATDSHRQPQTAIDSHRQPQTATDVLVLSILGSASNHEKDNDVDRAFCKRLVSLCGRAHSASSFRCCCMC